MRGRWTACGGMLSVATDAGAAAYCCDSPSLSLSHSHSHSLSLSVRRKKKNRKADSHFL